MDEIRKAFEKIITLPSYVRWRGKEDRYRQCWRKGNKKKNKESSWFDSTFSMYIDKRFKSFKDGYTAAQSTYKAQLNEALEGLREATYEEGETIASLGGCDHDSGLCCCDLYKQYDRHIAILSQYTRTETDCPDCGGSGKTGKETNPRLRDNPCSKCKGTGKIVDFVPKEETPNA